MTKTKENRRFLKADVWKQFSEKGYETDQAKKLPRTPVEKPFPEDAELIDLIAPENLTIGNMSVRDAIARRMSRRRFTDESLSLEELSYLLWAAQGVRSVFELKDGIATTRTVPSGGSLHSFETYLCINSVEGLTPGLYRYLPLEHKLLFIRTDDDLAADIAKACARQRYIKTAAVIFIWTTIPYRTEWRYGIAAHKTIAQDSGHLCENLYLAAESIGIGTCAVGAYYQEEMDAILGVDGEDEFTIYIAPVGRVKDTSDEN